jgi:CDP-diacylglycerol--serine O-phosphatidyltransferase
MVNALVILDIAFNTIVGLYNAKLFQRRFIADALSAVNLTCGLISIWFAWHNALEISLLFLILGGIFDGFDGAAARKWGGTRWGVYSDDVADGVNYGIAPACAMLFTIGGVEGWIVGGLYGTFTISRLIYFTLSKDSGDANFFSGVPSPVGGLIAMCSLVLFREQHVLLGLFTGMACIQMVSFDVRHRHLGRALATRQKKYIIGLPLYAIVLVLGAFVWGVDVSTALLLFMGISYGLLPSILHLKQAITKNEASD